MTGDDVGGADAVPLHPVAYSTFSRNLVSEYDTHESVTPNTVAMSQRS